MIYCYYGRKGPPASSRLPIQHVISEEFTKGQQLSGSSWLKCLSCSRTQQLLHQINEKYCFQCETCTLLIHIIWELENTGGEERETCNETWAERRGAAVHSAPPNWTLPCSVENYSRRVQPKVQTWLEIWTLLKHSEAVWAHCKHSSGSSCICSCSFNWVSGAFWPDTLTHRQPSTPNPPSLCTHTPLPSLSAPSQERPWVSGRAQALQQVTSVCMAADSSQN